MKIRSMTDKPNQRLPRREFVARRYRDAEEGLAHEFEKNRIKGKFAIGSITLVWNKTGWKNLFSKHDESDINIKVQNHSVVLFDGDIAIGIANFLTYKFEEFHTIEHFILEADNISQELFEFAEGVLSVMAYFHGADAKFFVEPGMRIIEFKRLVMKQACLSGCLPKPLDVVC